MYIELRVLALSSVFLLLVQSLSAQQLKNPDCRKLGDSFQRNVCSTIEDNNGVLIKNMMQKKSGENTEAGVYDWVKFYYPCFRCEEEPGFRGGALLRKVVFENALNVAFFFVYDARVDMNEVERDGRTLCDWLRDDTEKTFDAAFETEDAKDKLYLIKQIQINQKYYNLFKNNGGKFRHELQVGGSKF